MKKLSSFVWTVPIPELWGKEDLFVETIYPTAELSFKAIIEGQTLDLPSAIVDPHVIVGISIEHSGDLLTGRFYERFVDGIPDGFHDVGGALLRVRNEASKERLYLFGRQIAELVRDGHEFDALEPFLRVPVLAMPTAYNMIVGMTADDYRKVVDATIPKEKEESKVKLREALFTEVSNFHFELEHFLSGAYPVNEILPWDERLAGRITKLGGKEKVRKSQKGKSASELWKLWLPETTGEPCLAVKAIAFALWPKVKAEIESEKAKLEREGENPAAISCKVLDRLIGYHSPGVHVYPCTKSGQLLLMPRGEEDTKKALGEIKQGEEEVATMDMRALEDLICRGVGRLPSVHGHRVVYWEVVTGWAQAMARMPDARIISVEGGDKEIAELVGSPGRHDEIRSILLAQAYSHFKFPSWEGNLITHTEFKAKGQKRSRTDIGLGTVLMPHYVNKLTSKATEIAEGKRLVPMVKPCSFFIGRPNEHGAQCTLRLLYVSEMSRRAREMSEGGLIDGRNAFRRLSAIVGFTESFADKLYDIWVNHEDPFLKEADGRTTLSDREGNALSLIHISEPTRPY